jgi:GxxExxY protein
LWFVGRGIERDRLNDRVIGLAIAVHRELGPGLLESAYEACLAYELEQAGLPYQRQVALPVSYKNVDLDCGYRLDLLVDTALIVELKTVDAISKVHKAQLLTYLRLSRLRTGLILNFNCAVLKDGIHRMVR